MGTDTPPWWVKPAPERNVGHKADAALRIHAALAALPLSQMWRVRANRNERLHGLLCPRRRVWSAAVCELPAGHEGPHLDWEQAGLWIDPEPDRRTSFNFLLDDHRDTAAHSWSGTRAPYDSSSESSDEEDAW